MILIFFIRVAADLALYFSLANFLLLLTMPENVAAFWLPLALLLTSAVLSCAIKTKTGQKPLAFIPLLLPCLIPFLTSGWQPLLVTIPPIAYLGFLIVDDQDQLSYDRYYDRFVWGLKRMPLMIVPVIFNLSMAFFQLFQVRILPFVFIYFFCSILSLRLNRYYPGSQREKTVRAANILLLVFFIVACASIVYLQFWSYVWQGVVLFYQHVLTPILLAIAMIIAMPFFLIGMLIQWRAGDRASDDDAGVFSGLEEAMEPVFENTPVDGFPDLIRYIFILLLLFCFFLVAMRFFKSLSGGGLRRTEATAVTVSRHKLETTGGRGFDLLPPSDPRQAIRYYYRRFLRQCIKQGMETAPGQNSRDINVAAAALIETPVARESLESLRQLYITARYDDSGTTVVSKDDVRKVRHHYQTIKKALVKRPAVDGSVSRTSSGPD